MSSVTTKNDSAKAGIELWKQWEATRKCSNGDLIADDDDIDIDPTIESHMELFPRQSSECSVVSVASLTSVIFGETSFGHPSTKQPRQVVLATEYYC